MSKLNNNFILQNENAVYYECGFSCDNHLFLQFSNEKFLITDARYEIEANETAKVDQVIITNDLLGEAKHLLERNSIKDLMFDPFDFSVAQFKILKADSKINFIESENFSKLKRIIKTDDEIKNLKNAMQIGRDAFAIYKDYLFTHGFNKSEHFLNFKAKEIMSNTGIYDLSFDPIIAVDENSAKPHALPTEKLYTDNSLLLMDAGIKYKRYCSDRTRTYINNTSKLQQDVHDTVAKAQEEAITKARVGMKASQIDKIARDVIEKAGYGKYFVHSLGHGVGLDIHEYPNISHRSDTIIEDNMVFTVEPGIYLPDEFGVRIEDTVVMQNGKAVIL
jgi:Xaa-Pro aminopeptidase